MGLRVGRLESKDGFRHFCYHRFITVLGVFPCDSKGPFPASPLTSVLPGPLTFRWFGPMEDTGRRWRTKATCSLPWLFLRVTLGWLCSSTRLQLPWGSPLHGTAILSFHTALILPLRPPVRDHSLLLLPQRIYCTASCWFSNFAYTICDSLWKFLLWVCLLFLARILPDIIKIISKNKGLTQENTDWET